MGKTNDTLYSIYRYEEDEFKQEERRNEINERKYLQIIKRL